MPQVLVSVVAADIEGEECATKTDTQPPMTGNGPYCGAVISIDEGRAWVCLHFEHRISAHLTTVVASMAVTQQVLDRSSPFSSAAFLAPWNPCAPVMFDSFARSSKA